jgi:hypothetical protein
MNKMHTPSDAWVLPLGSSRICTSPSCIACEKACACSVLCVQTSQRMPIVITSIAPLPNYAVCMCDAPKGSGVVRRSICQASLSQVFLHPTVEPHGH